MAQKYNNVYPVSYSLLLSVSLTNLALNSSQLFFRFLRKKGKKNQFKTKKLIDNTVIPAQAGIQVEGNILKRLDRCLPLVAYLPFLREWQPMFIKTCQNAPLLGVGIGHMRQLSLTNGSGWLNWESGPQGPWNEFETSRSWQIISS